MKITVLGGGIGGLCAAIALENNGFEVQVLESSDAFKPVGAGISLSPNAVNALEVLGIKELVLSQAQQYKSGAILQVNGKIISSMNLSKIIKRTGGSFVSLHRHELHSALVSKLVSTKVRFQKRCIKMETQDPSIRLWFSDGTEETTDVLIAADGIHSVVRKHFLPDSGERYSGQTCWRGVCKSESILLNKVSESWGKGIRFGNVPLKDNRIYWFAVLDAPAQQHKNMRKEELKNLFKEFHDPIPRIIEQTDERDIFQSDLNDFHPIRQFAFGNVLLLGDAAHTTTPNMGQGACMAMEDAAMLHHLLSTNKNLTTVFPEFEKK
ncbi:MAG: FAD-dependent monooxygenase [Cytophagaceae bacterium]|jgi:2-polyprenyl-6-methoxyphenol hydroxylase-like FAD-dependent oxidoreductase|nr:FAD-dependent monooxygenase [Cytophagaceae bacterium]